MLLDEFTALCDVARELNEYVPPERARMAAPSSSTAPGDRPGDEYNRRALWTDVLEPHGWRVERTAGDATYWTRPGKTRGVSATTGKCRSEGGNDLLYVFSGNAHPFEPDSAYDKFGALTRLEHGGDFEKAGKALVSEGYGQPGADTSIVFGKGFIPATGQIVPVTDGPPDGRLFYWLSELRRCPLNEKWAWNGFISKGGITLLSALWKAGKSTLLAHLVRAFDAREPTFLGREIKPCRVLYVSEEDQETWAERRDDLVIGDHVGVICRPFKGRASIHQWADFLSAVLLAVAEHKFDVVVFDTMSKMWPVKDENNANQVEEALMPLWKLSQTGAAVLIVHHTRKSQGDNFTAARGSGGLSAFCETLVDFDRERGEGSASRRRVLRASGRYRETPQRWLIELSEDRREYRHVEGGEEDADETAPNDDTADVRERVLSVLPADPDDALSLNAIAKLVPGWVRTEVRRAYMIGLIQSGEALSSGGKYYRPEVLPLVPPLGTSGEAGFGNQ